MDITFKNLLNRVFATSVGVVRQFSENVKYYNDFVLTCDTIVTSRGEVYIVQDKENEEIHSIVVRRYTDHSSVPEEDFQHDTFDEYSWHNPDYTVENKNDWLKEFWNKTKYYSKKQRRYSTMYDTWNEDFTFDITDKVISITTGSEFDNTVLLEIDMDEEMLKEIKSAAARLEVTVNEFIEMSLDAAMFGKKQ